MLNYFQRLNSYRTNNYFQVNGSTLDVYVPTLPKWSQNLDVVKDILLHAHDLDIADSFEILTIRLTGVDLSQVEQAVFLETLTTANQVLGESHVKSEVWESMKPEGAAPRLFLAIVFDHQKPKPNDTKEPTTKRVRAVRDVPSDPESV